MKRQDETLSNKNSDTNSFSKESHKKTTYLRKYKTSISLTIFPCFGMHRSVCKIKLERKTIVIIAERK